MSSTHVTLEKGFALDAMEFIAHLEHIAKTAEHGNISSKIFGEFIAVIGGGNTAVDTARAAKRIDGVQDVSIIYRRTKQLMPANADDLELALTEGIKLYELLMPISHQNGILTCFKMKLGEPDSSGRSSPIETDEKVEIPADTVIAATGNKSNCAGCLMKSLKD